MTNQTYSSGISFNCRSIAKDWLEVEKKRPLPAKQGEE